MPWDRWDTLVTVVAVLLIVDTVAGGLGRGLVRIWALVLDMIEDAKFRWRTRR